MKTIKYMLLYIYTHTLVLLHQQHRPKHTAGCEQSKGLGMNSYHNHSVPGSESSVPFGWILDDVMDVTSMIITFGEGEAQAALF